MRSSRRRVSAIILACQGALYGAAGASVTYNSGSSSVTFTHIEDRNPSNGEVIHPNQVMTETPTATIPAGPTFQFNHTFTSGGGSGVTDAEISLAQVTNATTMSFNLGAGTGIDQTNTGYYNGQSQLTVGFNLHWTIGTGGFSFPTAYLSFNVAGDLAAGDTAVILSDPSSPLTFTAVSGANTYTVQPTVSATFNTVGAFLQNITSNQLIDGGATLPSGSTLALTGNLLFRAKDPLGPVNMGFLNGEVGSAPPTDTLVNTTGNWSDSTNWLSDGLAPAVPDTAEAFPVRAQFVQTVANADTARSITLDEKATLSELDFNDNVAATLSSVNADLDYFTFDPAFPAVIHVGALQPAAAGVTLGTPMFANGPSLDIQVASLDSSGDDALSIYGGITAGAATPVTKLGPGGVALTNTDNIQIYKAMEGRTDADASNTLGQTSTEVAGTLGYNANGASQAPVQVDSNGEVVLGVTPSASDVFDVKGNGTIAGTTAQLDALNAGNLTLEPGAMVTHLDTGGGDPVNVGTSPQLVYGVGTDFNSHSSVYAISVGSGSAGPWEGLGGDQGVHTYGSSPTSVSDAVTVQGNAELIALNGGVLTMNAQLTGAGTVTKDGGGEVILNSSIPSTFTGSVKVSNGTLVVNGSLPAGDVVQVGTPSADPPPAPPPGPPTLSGTGTVGGMVTLLSGGGIAPGMPDVAATFSSPEIPGSLGLLTVSSLSMNAGSFLDIRLGAGGSCDELKVNGNAMLGGTLDLIPDTDFSAGDYVFLDCGGTLSGAFDNIIVPPGFSATPDLAGGVYSVDVEPAAVPEPVMLPMLGIGGLALRRRGRRQGLPS